MSKSSRNNIIFKSEQREGGNSNSRHHFSPQSSPPSDKATSDTPNIPGVAADTSLPWLKDLWLFGRRRSLCRGRTKPDDNDVTSIKAHAEAMAESNRPIKWGAAESKILDDNVADIIKSTQKRIADLFKLRETAVQEQYEAERERANGCRIPDKPDSPFIATIFASLFLAASLLATFHDGIFYRIDVEQLSWFLTAIVALVASLPVVMLILGGYRSPAGSIGNYFRFAGGMTICFGFALMRVWSAAGSKQALFAGLSLFLIEAGMLLSLEAKAISLQNKYARYIRDKDEYDRFTELVNVARSKVSRIEENIKLEQARLEQYEKHIEDRISRYGQIDSLKQLAISVVLDGYFSGIAEVEGRYHSSWKYVNDNEERGG